LPARSAGAVAQSKRKQDHPSQREQNKKQQSNENDGHGRTKIRTKKEKVRRIRERSETAATKAWESSCCAEIQWEGLEWCLAPHGEMIRLEL
jgi:hypothetical protein